MRVRDIQPGEEVENLYEEATDPRNRHVMFDIESSVASGEPLAEFEAPAKLFYNENDEAEDRVLFPEEYQEDGAEIAVGDELNALAKLEYQGPDMRRFVHDLDTDDELPDSQHGDASDEEDEWEDDDSCEQSDVSGSELALTKEESVNELLQRYSNEEVEYLEHASRFPEPSDDPNYDMEGQYRRFLTREMAKTVKEGWHKADLEPGAQSRYQLAQELTKKMVLFNRAKRPLTQLSPLAFLNINPYKHRKVIPEMERAFSMMSLFFPFAEEFFRSNSGFEEHALVDQAERAKHPPVRRYKHSNKTMPKSFWREWDEIKRKPGRMVDKYPAEWDAAIRPIIAHLCKEEILLSSYVPETMAVAIASREPTGTLDLYIDNRVAMAYSKPHAGSIFPPEKERLLKAAQRFAALKPDARFAFLRVWSAPHFWPLIVGPDRERREEFTFMDSQGRSWMWKFVPKDTPCSEMSIHMGVHYRVQPFKKLFGEKLILRSDTLLVMGEDEKELLKLASAATYAVQDDPWRLEIDLWKSFVNIDIKTLEGLDVGWLD